MATERESMDRRPEMFEFANGTFLVHRKADCDDTTPCPIHNPSLHPMVEEPMILRLDSFKFGLIERRCIHGVGHPDPDSVAFFDASGPRGAIGTWGIHGCDGCCTKTLERCGGRSDG